MDHLPIDRPFQRVSVDLVEYETASLSPTELSCTRVFTVIDNLTRFAVLIPLPNKQELTEANTLVQRGILLFDMGLEFESKVVRQLQKVFS